MTLRLGSERLLASNRLDGRRVGIVANPASIDGSFRHVVDRLASHPGATLAAIFGPQHGFRADVQDNMIESPHGQDASRRVPVYSLYSETREPTAEMLKGLDVLVIDLQDVGARIYTFIYTMANCLQGRRAARRAGRRLRPPEPDRRGGGRRAGPRGRVRVVRRPLPDPDAARDDRRRAGAPVQRGATASAPISRSCRWRAGSAGCTGTRPGCRGSLPSPNMPTLDTAIVYPGAVLFEGTQLSEGRGTTRPFEILGAPWIDCGAVRGRAERPRASRGRTSGRSSSSRPSTSTRTRRAVAARSTSPIAAPSDPCSRRSRSSAPSTTPAPERFAWRQPPYEYEHRPDADRHPRGVGRAAGGGSKRTGRSGTSPRSWDEPTRRFEDVRRKYLLYQ